jgi:hypothetical protein
MTPPAGEALKDRKETVNVAGVGWRWGHGREKNKVDF